MNALDGQLSELAGIVRVSVAPQPEQVRVCLPSWKQPAGSVVSHAPQVWVCGVGSEPPRVVYHVFEPAAGA